MMGNSLGTTVTGHVTFNNCLLVAAVPISSKLGAFEARYGVLCSSPLALVIEVPGGDVCERVLSWAI